MLNEPEKSPPGSFRIEKYMSGISYRPSIDGMRAIAVMSVLLFHLDKRLLPGGFVGVDVFFVISGYLITSIIHADCKDNEFSISRFYQRRISRIFPVFFLVSLSILCAAAAMYSSQDFAKVGAMASASALSIANLKLMVQGDYFKVTDDAQPFLHFWSLSVEEQFYFVFPVAMLAANKLRVSRKWLLTLMVMLATVSFGGCVMFTSIKQPWAFYLLPTRAWELLAGAILAIVSDGNRKSMLPLAESSLSLLGLLLLLLSFFFMSETLAFPGYIALLPVFASTLLIGVSHDRHQPTELILSNSVLVYIGKLSYSLYLWHWPVYCFTDYVLFSESVAQRTVVKVGLTLILSLVSYICIENRIRRYLNHPRRIHFVFCCLAAGIAAFTIVGVSIRSLYYVNAPINSVAEGGVEFTSSGNSSSIVLMGDSNGSMYGIAIKKSAVGAGINLNVISVAGGDPLPNSKLYAASLRFLTVKKPAVTIFAADWVKHISHNKSRLQTALSEMLDCSQHIVLITQPPVLPQTASREWIRENGTPDFVAEDSATALARDETNAFILSLNDKRIHVLNIESLFMNANEEIVLHNRSGKALFQDKGHLSDYGAEMVNELLFPEVLKLIRSEFHGSP